MRRVKGIVWITVAVLLVALPGCNRYALKSTADEGQKSFSATSQVSAGPEFTWIADVQASRIAGPTQEFLPIHLAVLNEVKEPLEFTRESFTLELAAEGGERIVLPLASSAEVEAEHGRQQMDLRIGTRFFLEVINGRYPSPPFFKRPLEFFSLRGSSIVPRNDMFLRQAELAQGLIYFRLPDERPAPEDTVFRLLFQPNSKPDGTTRERYVLTIEPYDL